jgi:hypothetical protein
MRIAKFFHRKIDFALRNNTNKKSRYSKSVQGGLHFSVLGAVYDAIKS